MFLGLAVSEDQGSWAVAGDQVILTVTGVDMAKVRCVGRDAIRL